MRGVRGMFVMCMFNTLDVLSMHCSLIAELTFAFVEMIIL